MWLLALETAFNQLSVALANVSSTDANSGIAPQVISLAGARMQTQSVLPSIDRLLSEQGISSNQLGLLAFSCGPGAFTGVRLGATVVQALGWAHCVPVVAVPSLQALAHAYARLHGARAPIVCVVDAKMGEVFTAIYQVASTGQVTELQAPALRPIASIAAWQQTLAYDHYVGDGCALLGIAPNHSDVLPSAEDVASLAQAQWQAGTTIDATNALPVYLRGADAWKKSPSTAPAL